MIYYHAIMKACKHAYTHNQLNQVTMLARRTHALGLQYIAYPHPFACARSKSAHMRVFATAGMRVCVGCMQAGKTEFHTHTHTHEHEHQMSNA